MSHNRCNLQTQVIYDFSFADLSVKYLETGDAEFLQKISELEAAEHLFNHALSYNNNIPAKSKAELTAYLLSPLEEQKKRLPDFKRNLAFARKSIADTDFAGKVVSQFLPKDFAFSSRIFFTFGYDIGVAYGNNCSLNLAHPIFRNNMNEIKYYTVHELHHTGFIALKGGYMPSFKISARGEMAHIIEYLTHMEGMGTYAPFAAREKDNALNTNGDYIALQDSNMMVELEKEYFDIYLHFKNNPGKLLTEDDWCKINILSDAKRLWYRVGSNMARAIDIKLGRDKLTGIISEPSENFIAAYLGL